MARRIVDAHHHLWDLRGGYPWLQNPVDPLRFTGDDTPIRTDYLAPDYLADVGEYDLVASVHIDAGAADGVAEARWVQAVHDESGIPTVAVAGIDLRDPKAPAHLETIAGLGTTRGIRHILNWHETPGWTYTDSPHIMSAPGWRANFARLAPLGLSFDLQVFPGQLVEAAGLASDFPETTFVLNHTGMPESSDPDHVALWRRGIRALAERPNVFAKVSGLGMTHHDWTVDTIRPFALDVIDAFGTTRTAFASNFPVDRLYSSFAAVYSAFEEIVVDFTEAEQDDLFVGTASRVYRIELS